MTDENPEPVRPDATVDLSNVPPDDVIQTGMLGQGPEHLLQAGEQAATAGRTEVRMRLTAEGQEMAKQVAAYFGINWLTLVFFLLHRELEIVESALVRHLARDLTDDEHEYLTTVKHELAPPTPTRVQDFDEDFADPT